MRSGKCKINLNNFDVGGVGIPGPSMPGFGANISMPGLDIEFPEGFPENIFDLLNKLKLKWPLGMDLSSMADNFMRKLSQIISNILTQVSAFLAIYNILLAIIQIIVCIIEVLCGMVWKAPKKLRRLFRKCLPLFISIFPFLALIALILSILALLLALIEYVIGIIKKIYEELKRNYENLKKATKREQSPQKSAAMIAITRKIASILCILENVMVLFMIIMGVIELIKGILSKSIAPPCDNKSDCDDCTSCSELLLHSNKLSNTNCNLRYDVTGPMIVGLESVETVRLYSDELKNIEQGQYTFANLLSSTYNGHKVGPFFPPYNIDKTYTPERAPYTLDISFSYGTGNTQRTITITNIIVQWVSKDIHSDGCLTLFGGTINDPNKELTGDITTFFNKGIKPIAMPGSSLQPKIQTCIMTSFKPNFDILPTMNLTTLDCNPELINDKLAFYNSINTNAMDGLEFPDIDGAMNKFNDSLAKLRSKIDDDAIDKFAKDVNDIMNDLKDQAENTYSQTLQFMVSPLHSYATLEPAFQFTSKGIRVHVTLRNASKQSFKDVMGDFEIPEKAKTDLLNKLTTNLSLGAISTFDYEASSGNFIADITSIKGGEGVLKLYYDNQQFGELIVPDSMDLPSKITELEYCYTFIDGMIADGETRKDETDTANK